MIDKEEIMRLKEELRDKKEMVRALHKAALSNLQELSILKKKLEGITVERVEKIIRENGRYNEILDIYSFANKAEDGASMCGIKQLAQAICKELKCSG